MPKTKTDVAEKPKSKRGRPSTYGNSDPVKIIAVLLAFGATEIQIAKCFNMSKAGFKKWKLAHPEIVSPLKTLKAEADEMVENSLFRKALAGDTTACIFWLKNRKPGEWRDRREYDGNLRVEQINANEFANTSSEELRRFISTGGMSLIGGN